MRPYARVDIYSASRLQESDKIQATRKLLAQERGVMTPAEIKSVLLWSLVINYSLLSVWFSAFVFGRDTLYPLHSRWLRTRSRPLMRLTMRAWLSTKSGYSC
jgi:hypothetical protein